jgi:DNA-binding GntR family transcriptional regulator
MLELDSEAPARDSERTQSLTIQAHTRMRSQIISGELPPNRKLKVEVLRDLLGVGATPIREALSLLTAEGLVERLDKRGFRVAAVSLAEYDDLHRTRCWMEEHALRESIALGDTAWEEAIVLVQHRLKRLPRTITDDLGTRSNPDWEHMHKQFHMTILSASTSETILRFCSQLHDRLNRYRSVAAVASHSPRDWKSEHEGIAQAVLDRDAGEAVDRLIRHYSRTGDILRSTLKEMSVSR